MHTSIKHLRFVAFTVLFGLAATLPILAHEEDRIAPEEDLEFLNTPDWSESKGATMEFFGPLAAERAFGNTGPSAQQTRGVLSGKIVFMNSGHGWTFDPTYWRLQRPSLLDMNEDYGNYDQLNFFASYCFNAGATVVSMRPLGRQTNEVILDNDDAAVTFAGTWGNSGSGVFWGNAGDLPYRFASMAATESATATYTPNIPVAGYYPVYCWTLHGSDRGDQLYRIRHTGGESEVRIPHHMVGNGWIYLGEYYFNAGSSAPVGSVVISNLRESPTGSVVIADAIRFGNGMGTVDFGTGVSGYPREDESMRYWIQANLAQGQATSLYDGSGDHESDSWSAPPKMSAHMNRQEAGDIYDRIHISFHSNAGGGRGAVGLITSTPTPNQAQLAQIAGAEVNNDLSALGMPLLETNWSSRTTHTYSGGYSEITGSLFNYEMPATIIEVAYHDNAADSMLMRDPKVRSAVGKAALHAVVKFMNQYDTNGAPPLAFLPEAPTNLRAIAGTNGQIALAWTAPIALGGSQNPTNYIIYRSTNGYGFGNPIFVGNALSYTITDLAADTDYYFRVTASNAGGESMPSEVVGCRASSVLDAPRVLIVNGFDLFNRTHNLRHDVARQNWDKPGNNGAIERVFPRWNNAFDYVVQHGKAIAAAGRAFDSCQNEAVISNQVLLANYDIVIWACGNETTDSETFSSLEQSRISTYLANRGSLFVSGSDVAFDLDRASGPTTGDRNFLRNQLHATLVNDDSANYTAASLSGWMFAGNSSVTIDNGTRGIYWVQSPDVLSPDGHGAVAAMNYSGSGAAAIQYDGSASGGRTLLMGFPFETITDATRRNQYMADILTFLSLPPATNYPPVIFVQPQGQTVSYGTNVSLSVSASGTLPFSYQWRLNGTNIPGATGAGYAKSNLTTNDSGPYTLVITNSFGSVTSQVATLTVLPPQPPIVSAQPQSRTVSYGTNVTFSVAVSGAAPFSYQWRFYGTNIAGATGTNYTKFNLTTNDSGPYTVVITNSFGSITSQVATLNVLAPLPPSITTQPQSQIIVQGSNTTLTVGVSGTAPFSYQWRFNGNNLGVTQSSLARNNVQFLNSGNYQVVVSSAFGSVTSAIAVLQVAMPISFQTVFSDKFDANTAAAWTVNSSSADTRVTFNYNYASDGIPAAPNSGGTTRGVKFEANMVAPGEAAAINVSPIGQSFAGDMRLRFDMWINANGPFPAGGTGSSEHGMGGVGTAGNRVQWTGTGSTADGVWFGADGEGQAGTSTTTLNDFSAFSGTTHHAAGSGIYAAGTASNSRAQSHAYYSGAFPAGQTAPALQQSNYPQQTGSLEVGTIGFAWRDVIISKMGDTVEWFIDGLKIATIENVNVTANNIFIGYWDSFNSLSDNANLSFGLFDNVRVERFVTNVPPYLTSQPLSQNLKTGTNATFTVTAGGTASLSYQWRFKNVTIPGANSSSYTRQNLTTNDAGLYSVVVTNVTGAVTSGSALLTVIEPIPPQFSGTAVQNGSELKLTLTGEPGTSITILNSTNLVTWESVTNIANPTGTVEFISPIVSDSPQQFYRAQLGSE